MAKSGKFPLLAALQEGKPYTWTVDEGGDLASMRAALKHGQTLTISPIRSPLEIQVGDKVFLRWGSFYMFHIVGEIQEGQYLIVNSLGKVNGWVGPEAILGRVTKVIEPEPRPSVPEMLDALEACCREMIAAEEPGNDLSHRLLKVVDDLRWYAGRLGEARWDATPRSNRWSFAQNLWRFTRQMGRAEAAQHDVTFWIDRGMGYVGLAATLLGLLDYDEADWPY